MRIVQFNANLGIYCVYEYVLWVNLILNSVTEMIQHLTNSCIVPANFYFLKINVIRNLIWFYYIEF